MKNLFFIISLFFLCINTAICMPAESTTLATTSYNKVEFNISKAEIINTGLKFFGSPETTQMKLDRYLLITLELKNNDEKAINYKSTVFTGGPGKVSLDDEFGGHYYRISNTGNDEDNGMVIYPGESGKIKLAFQKPSPNAKHLILSFPKFNIWDKVLSGTITKEDLVVKIDFDASKVSVLKKEETKTFELAFGEEFRKDGLVIKVKNVELSYLTVKEGEYIKSYPSTLQEKNSKKVKMIAISYEFINDTGNKKIDLSQNFQLSLTDDSDNKYNSYPALEDYDISRTSIKPEHFPSIYPGESYGETIFFEAPIGIAKYLLLNIDATNIGIKDKIIVTIPVEKIIGR